MSFNFFSLDYIYYPVSGILWVWHKVFGLFLGADNAWAWVLSVVFLVFTLRAILFKPFMKQMNSSLRMQELQPQMRKIREKYKDDRQRQSEELMKLNKEAGVNPLAGCLPALVQAPVFLALFHVLREFKPGKTENYFFNAADVQSFVDAKLFGGAPLSAYITMPADQLAALGGIHSTVVAVAIPLMIMAGIATHMTSRRSVGRQSADAAAQPQTRIMNKVMLYLFPIGVIVGGPFFPIAILIYWLSNNTWTFGQLWAAHKIQDRQKAEVEQVIEAEEAAKRYSTPKPGARPVAKRPADGATKDDRPVVTPTPIGRDDDGPVVADSSDGVILNGEPLKGATSNGTTNGAAKPVSGSPPKPATRPAPGARPPAQRKKQRKK